jgi:hypothetical protein
VRVQLLDGPEVQIGLDVVAQRSREREQVPDFGGLGLDNVRTCSVATRFTVSTVKKVNS